MSQDQTSGRSVNPRNECIEKTAKRIEKQSRSKNKLLPPFGCAQHLHKSLTVYPSVGPSIGPSIRRSVHPSMKTTKNERDRVTEAHRWLTRPRW